MTAQFTKCIAVAIQAIVARTNGTKINGINNIGFNTIGAPKIIGSLILNSEGRIVVLPSVLPYLLLAAKQNRIASPKVAPEPPIWTNHCKNGSTPI